LLLYFKLPSYLVQAYCQRSGYILSDDFADVFVVDDVADKSCQ